MKPEDRPEPFWKSPEDWYEFFHFVCPHCKLDYVADQGSAFAMRCRPRPLAISAKWDPTTAAISFSASVVCACMVKFDVNGSS